MHSIGMHIHTTYFLRMPRKERIKTTPKKKKKKFSAAPAPDEVWARHCPTEIEQLAHTHTHTHTD